MLAQAALRDTAGFLWLTSTGTSGQGTILQTMCSSQSSLIQLREAHRRCQRNQIWILRPVYVKTVLTVCPRFANHERTLRAHNRGNKTNDGI